MTAHPPRFSVRWVHSVCFAALLRQGYEGQAGSDPARVARTSNIERPTSNIEVKNEELTFQTLHFDVGSSMFDVQEHSTRLSLPHSISRATGKRVPCFQSSLWRAEQKWTELIRAKVDFFNEVPIALVSAS